MAVTEAREIMALNKLPSVQCYFLKPTPSAPNNPLPVLIYRNVLPRPHSEESTTQFLTSNKWEKRGTWGHIAIRHFHPNSHECYGIFQGSSTMILGQLTSTESGGLQVCLRAGDVIVLPAGTGHASLKSTPDYRYIGVYPDNCPRWRNEVGDNPPETFFKTIEQVGYPEADPVYGVDGPLVRIWQPRVLAKL